MRHSNKVIRKHLPPLKEEERIYLNVPYMARSFAQYSNCGFDSKKKVRFTGPRNSNLETLVKLYGVNEATSQKVQQEILKLIETEQDDY